MSFTDLFRKTPGHAVRKKYNKMHSRIDHLPDIENRVELLRMLGKVEPQLMTLENTVMNYYEKKKAVDFINSGIREMDLILSGIKAGRRKRFSI